MGRSRVIPKLDKVSDYIYQVLREIRTSDNICPLVREILREKDYRKGINTEDAKAFLIKVIYENFGVGTDADVLLMAFGLLAGYDRWKINGRRRHYIIETERLRGESVFANLPKEKQNDEVNNMKGREDPLIQKMAVAIGEISETEIAEYFKDNRKYTRTGPQGRRIADLPRPNYLIARRDYPINNLPSRGELFIGRETYLASLLESFNRGENIQILSGMGGVGKTRLALQYALVNAPRYSYICWVNAENEDGIQRSCHAFLMCESLDVSRGELESAKAVFLDFFDHHNNWLIIYDNADYSIDEDRKVLDAYIPKSINGTGHILLTTQCGRAFHGIAPLYVDVFDNNEATKFLLSHSKCQDMENAAKLAERLGKHPLALEFAAAYVRETYGVGYDEYLQKLERNGVRLLDVSDIEIFNYSKTVRETFHLTLDKLRVKAEDDLIAKATCQFIEYSAYLAPEHIDLSIFGGDSIPNPLRTVCSQELDRERLLRLLTSHSLFFSDCGLLSTHRLLQEIQRDELGGEGKNLVSDLISCIATGLSGMLASGDIAGFGHVVRAFYRNCEPHLLKLSTYLYFFPSDVSEKYITVLSQNYVTCAVQVLMRTMQSKEDGEIYRICSSELWTHGLNSFIEEYTTEKREDDLLQLYLASFVAIGCYGTYVFLLGDKRDISEILPYCDVGARAGSEVMQKIPMFHLISSLTMQMSIYSSLHHIVMGNFEKSLAYNAIFEETSHYAAAFYSKKDGIDAILTHEFKSISHDIQKIADSYYCNPFDIESEINKLLKRISSNPILFPYFYPT